MKVGLQKFPFDQMTKGEPFYVVEPKSVQRNAQLCLCIKKRQVDLFS